MPRNRMIKTEFWNDEKMALVSRDARLTFIALWNLSDDYGSVRGHPLWLKNTIYPYDEIKPADFKKWIEELENIHAILPYDGDGEKFFYIRCFTKHQVIGRPSQFKNPPPPATLIEDSLSNHGVLADEAKRERERERERERSPGKGQKKIKFLDFVFLNEEEKNKLFKKFGEKGTDDRISALDIYIGKIGEKAASKKYKSHYHTILDWERRNGGGEVRASKNTGNLDEKNKNKKEEENERNTGV